MKGVGSGLQAKVGSRRQPVSSGYDSDDLAVDSAEGLAFQVSNIASPGGKARKRGSRAIADNHERPTGRGGKQDVDVPQGRPFVAAAPLPDPEPWEAAAVNEEQAQIGRAHV